MDGLSRTAGIGPTIKLGGRSLTVNAKILRHYAEMEAEIIRKRGNPFDLIRQAKEALRDAPEIMETFVTRAFDEALKWRYVSQQDLADFMNTFGGVCFSIWLSVRDNDPAEFTLEKTTELIVDQMEELRLTKGPQAAADFQAGLEAALSQANGEDELGNSTGSQPSAGAAGQ